MSRSAAGMSISYFSGPVQASALPMGRWLRSTASSVVPSLTNVALNLKSFHDEQPGRIRMSIHTSARGGETTRIRGDRISQCGRSNLKAYATYKPAAAATTAAAVPKMTTQAETPPAVPTVAR